jgi:hypothetical protein
VIFLVDRGLVRPTDPDPIDDARHLIALANRSRNQVRVRVNAIPLLVSPGDTVQRIVDDYRAGGRFLEIHPLALLTMLGEL